MTDKKGNDQYGAKELEVLAETPENPEAFGWMKRRSFLKGVMATGAAAGAVAVAVKGMAPKTAYAEGGGDGTPEPPQKDIPNDILAQCPYCGVGCGTLIQTEKGRIVGMKPDPKHPTNKGLQCIKGLTSAEAIYVDRLTKPLIRIDHTDIL